MPTDNCEVNSVVPSIPDVGDQDPAEPNSRIAAREDGETPYLRQHVPGDTVCYFNDVRYSHGSFVKSGTVILRCDRGIWVEAGPADADNP
jgi:hypothetical protein